AYEQALVVDPRSPDAALARLRTGVLYTERGRLDAAEKAIQQALAEGAPKAEAHSALGDLYASTNNVAGALASYRQAVEIDGRRPLLPRGEGPRGPRPGGRRAQRLPRGGLREPEPRRRVGADRRHPRGRGPQGRRGRGARRAHPREAGRAVVEAPPRQDPDR